MSNKQSSVEWLEIELQKLWVEKYLSPITIKSLFEQAKAMNEKELEDYFKRGENNYKRGYKPITFKEFHNGYSKDGKE
jgi:hypothetical protein